MMKKNSIGGFMLVAILMQLLHTLRGDLTFIIDGKLPYVLYHGTMALYVICLLGYLNGIIKNLRGKRKSG